MYCVLHLSVVSVPRIIVQVLRRYCTIEYCNMFGMEFTVEISLEVARFLICCSRGVYGMESCTPPGSLVTALPPFCVHSCMAGGTGNSYN